jgi:hypothetical protein
VHGSTAHSDSSYGNLWRAIRDGIAVILVDGIGSTNHAGLTVGARRGKIRRHRSGGTWPGTIFAALAVYRGRCDAYQGCRLRRLAGGADTVGPVNALIWIRLMIGASHVYISESGGGGCRCCRVHGRDVCGACAWVLCRVPAASGKCTSNHHSR